MDKRGVRLGVTVWATVAGTLLLLPTARAAELPPKLKELLREAQDLQDKGYYARAWEKYHQIRVAAHNPPEEVTRGAQICLRRVQQARRLRDKSSQALLGNLKSSEALTVYVKVLRDLQKNYFEESKVTPADLFQYGVQEMRLALEDDAFLSPTVNPAALQALKDRLDGLRSDRPGIEEPADARKHLESVLLSAASLGLKPNVVLVEFISGACNALDEYTGYLSPRRLEQIETDLSGKFVGIGVDVAVVATKDGKQLFIKNVYPDSPAQKEALVVGQVILSIDGQTPDPESPGSLIARLAGEAGTKVVLEVAFLTADGMKPTDGMKRKVTVERQPVIIPSVPQAEYDPATGIGYVRLISFQKTTPQELRSQVLWLRSQPSGLKGLILDLRGNLGGALEAALEVAEQFLSEGVILITQFRTREDVRRASNAGALTLPLVVLVDGETASSAEIVAGALKENNRAELVGQPTYGKGSIQCVVKLKSLRAGMQVTIARFSSPDRVPYDGHGVTPHHVVESTVTMMSADPQRDEAFALLAKKLMMSPALKMPPLN
ncbi:MAG TPA: S41 family peptidase [Gemmataceae bacterium]|nr:S41 family peptidase [Gemmataceae bacterium]